MELKESDGSKGLLRPRINGELMAEYLGKQVSLLGVASDVEGQGLSFKLKASDGALITVRLLEPNDGYIGGTVEVYGKVTSKTSILCDNLLVFPQEYCDNMDLSQYNEAVKILHQTNHYDVGFD